MITDESARMPCRYCAAPLQATDVNVQLAVARCGSCHAVYSFADEARDRLGAVERPPVPLPKGYAVSRDGGTLTITRRWRSPAAFALLAFCAFWDGFLVLWMAGAVAAGNAAMALFPIIHIAVGVLLTYTMVAQFLNTTTISVGGGQLRVWHGPMPWPGKKELSTAGLAQLWCVEKMHRRKRGYSYTYEVHAKTRQGADHTLLRSLADAEQALYLEQQIEKHLRIADAPVAGELRR